MTSSRYDANVEYYVQHVDKALVDPKGFWQPLLKCYDSLLKERLPGRSVVDIACGEGHLSRRLAALGAGRVVGIDISGELLQVAAQRTSDPRVTFRKDDAQALESLPSASIDIAVSKLAIMDIPNHRTLFRAVHRVLIPDGFFVFSLLHPCFEAPFHLPEAPQFQEDESGAPAAYLVHEYAREGHWFSGGDGVRGRVGAYHRTLSTLINDLLAAGFTLRGLYEPTPTTSGLFGRVPRALLLEAQVCA